MLLEGGFNVMSTDASDKMLKYALKERWARRKEAAFDKWGNYSHLYLYFLFLQNVCLENKIQNINDSVFKPSFLPFKIVTFD